MVIGERLYVAETLLGKAGITVWVTRSHYETDDTERTQRERLYECRSNSGSTEIVQYKGGKAKSEHGTDCFRPGSV